MTIDWHAIPPEYYYASLSIRYSQSMPALEAAGTDTDGAGKRTWILSRTPFLVWLYSVMVV